MRHGCLVCRWLCFVLSHWSPKQKMELLLLIVATAQVNTTAELRRAGWRTAHHKSSGPAWHQSVIFPGTFHELVEEKSFHLLFIAHCQFSGQTNGWPCPSQSHKSVRLSGESNGHAKVQPKAQAPRKAQHLPGRRDWAWLIFKKYYLLAAKKKERNCCYRLMHSIVALNTKGT
jgi:hypothetical protein